MLNSIQSVPQASINQHNKITNQKNSSVKDNSLLQPPKTQNTNKVKSLDHKEERDNSEQKQEGRETYGLSLLELMTDSEYAAFERITAHMTHGEKLMSAQSLYRLTSLQEAEGANYPKEMKNGYGNTINFGDKFSKAVAWGDVALDQHS